MKKYDYIARRVISVGGRVLASNELTTLDSKVLKIAIAQKVIKENGKKGDTKTTNIEGENPDQNEN
jgi:hypothetical protein